MTVENRPDWLARALEETAPSLSVPFPDGPEWPIKVQPGDIRAARPMDGEGGARLVLITSLGDEDHTWVNTMLLSNLVEVATSKDVFLHPEEIKLPFPIRVETDIAGPMFIGQFGPRLGTVDENMLAALQVVKLGEDLEVMADRRGLPVRSRKEHRARWKEKELQAMHDLAGECFSRLVLEDESEEVLVDPGLFEEADQRGDLMALLRVVDLLREDGHEIELPEESLLEDAGGIRAWLGALGPDEWRAIEPLIQRVLTASPITRVDTAVEWRPGRTADDSILRRRIAARAARGDRSVRLATKASLWRSGELRDTVLVAELEGMGIVQVRAELMEEAA